MPSFILPHLRRAQPYVPGEQLRSSDVLKLNTNENPYPPSPKVFAALQSELRGETLRKYPDPSARAFREAAAAQLGVEPDWILAGNGSDEILTILMRACVPVGGWVAVPTPSYVLYQTLADLHGARCHLVPFTADWRMPVEAIPGDAALTFLPNPNSPSGTVIPTEELAHWPTPLVLDEAYVDFASAHGIDLVRRNERVIVTRSLSKSYALAGIRFGFAVAQPHVIAELAKLKDSYNCDVLSQAAATAAILDQEYFQRIRQQVITTRTRMEREFMRLGFEVTPSQANFVWCQQSGRPLQPIAEALKARGILVRWMRYAGYGEGLRISVGTDEEIDRLLVELADCLR